jgi:hypothetical protein
MRNVRERMHPFIIALTEVEEYANLSTTAFRSAGTGMLCPTISSFRTESPKLYATGMEIDAFPTEAVSKLTLTMVMTGVSRFLLFATCVTKIRGRVRK